MRRSRRRHQAAEAACSSVPSQREFGRVIPPRVKRVLVRIRNGAPYLPWLLLAIAVGFAVLAALLFLLLRVLPDWIAKSDADVSSVRTGVLAILAGTVAVFGAVYTAKTYALTRQGQLTDRFSRAVEQLGNTSLDVTLGGIYALARIARESPEDYRPVMEVLAAYVRERVAWQQRSDLRRDGPQPAFQNWMGQPPANWPPIMPDTNVQAALTVLARPGVGPDVERFPLDLSKTDLRGAQLADAELEMANLMDAHLTDARLSKARLEGASLGRAELAGANLAEACLRGADLKDACLDGVFALGADFRHRKLTETFWVGTSFINATLKDAHLQDAIFAGASLKGVEFRESLLYSTDFEGARLQGADLSKAHLEGSKFASAIFDSKTQWPPGFDPDANGAVRDENVA